MAFPSPLERTVASALLLLSTTPPLTSPPSTLGGEGEKKYAKELSERKSSSGEESSSLVSISSKSCVSSVTSHRSSFKEIGAQKLRIVAAVSRCREMKLQVARRKRSKANWSSDDKTTTELAPSVTAEASTDSVSCLSSTNSGASSARSQNMKRNELLAKPARNERNAPKRIRYTYDSVTGRPYMRNRAKAILKLLSSGSFSEFLIRQVLGDSPSTSKALRMLLRQEEVKRTGTGGRHDPFIYTIA